MEKLSSECDYDLLSLFSAKGKQFPWTMNSLNTRERKSLSKEPRYTRETMKANPIAYKSININPITRIFLVYLVLLNPIKSNKLASRPLLNSKLPSYIQDLPKF